MIVKNKEKEILISNFNSYTWSLYCDHVSSIRLLQEVCTFEVNGVEVCIIHYSYWLNSEANTRFSEFFYLSLPRHMPSAWSKKML